MNIEDLKETARLAHLNLTGDELAGAFPAFEQLLDFFAVMQGADDDGEAFPSPISRGGEPLWTAASSHFRTDQPLSPHNQSPPPHSQGGLAQNLLNNAGERDGPFIVVPNVL